MPHDIMRAELTLISCPPEIHAHALCSAHMVRPTTMLSIRMAAHNTPVGIYGTCYQSDSLGKGLTRAKICGRGPDLEVTMTRGSDTYTRE
ncbi:hypothetical protein Hamer_G008319 [Homarus americanus]|uniref:Uncharacterized protein n=1 Tax=Homarus americanus TaxID=6706 RepID=A0A8J5ND71_HOMAM|nr:hypothetical protein Hamer_G008319 [Homarus americanus]